MVTHLFKDNVSWPLGSLRFYLGLIPHLLPPTESQKLLPDESNRLLTWRLRHSCHVFGIRLAAHIWGTVVRHYVETTSPPRARGQLDRNAMLRNAGLTLPPYLNTFYNYSFHFQYFTFPSQQGNVIRYLPGYIT